MTAELWPVIAVVYTFVTACYVMTNDIFRQDGAVAVFWRSLFSAVLLLPVCLFCEWPQDWRFYALVVGAGLLAAIADIIMFQAFKRHGGAAISRMYGLRPITIFFMWLAIDSTSLHTMTAAPWLMGGIIACLAASGLAMVFARKNPISRAAFMAFLPCLILFSLCDMGQKLSAPTGATGLGRALIITLGYSIIMTIVSGIYMLMKERTLIVPERVWLSAGVNGIIFIVLVVVKTFGLSLTPNPAYFNALSLLVVIWTYLLHRYLFKKDDHASPVAGFVVVASAAALTILVSMLPK